MNAGRQFAFKVLAARSATPGFLRADKAGADVGREQEEEEIFYHKNLA